MSEDQRDMSATLRASARTTGYTPTNRLMKFFGYGQLPPNAQGPSKSCAMLAAEMDDLLAESAEKTAGLRLLLQAKDCFVRAKLEQDGVV